MSTTQRLLGALALAAALSPAAFAQGTDCRQLATSPGLLPAECRRAAADVAPADGPSVSGPTDASFGFDALNDFTSPAYVRFTQNQPTVATNVANATVASGDFLNACDFQGNNLSTWYCLSFLGAALTVNPVNGAQTPLGTIATTNGWGDLAYDYQTNQFFAIEADCSTGTTLSIVNFSTLTKTVIGTATNATCGVGLAAHPTTGQLYMLNLDVSAAGTPDQIYTLNKTTGAATLLGNAGFDANFAQSMDFDNQDGTLYLYAFNLTEFNNFQPPAELRTVNLTNGSTTLVGKITGSATDREITAGSSETQTVQACAITFAQQTTATFDPIARRITFSGRVVNPGPATQVRLDIDYARVGGGPSGTLSFGPTTLPQTGGSGVPFSVQQPVPATAPAGTYSLTFRLVDVGAGGAPCATQSGSVVISAPRVSGGDVAAWEAGEITVGASAVVAEGTVSVAPNPFSARTALSFTVAEASEVRLSVYDVLGREVATLVNGRVEAGAHTATFEAGALAAGTYVYRLSVNGEVETGRITLAR